MSLEEWWNLLKDSGWLDEASEDEAERIKAEAEQYADDPSWAFNALAASGGDAECIENDGDYSKWVVEAYEEASGGVFAPKNVKDAVDWDRGVATVSFEVGGKVFQTEFAQEDDYVAVEVHEFMNEVMAALGEPKRFYILPTDDQTYGLVCVTPETYERACSLGLIPNQEDWPPAED